MAFTPTLVDTLAPDYAGTKKIERWTATALATDSGPGTITARYITKIDDFDVESYNGSAPTTYQISGNKLILQLSPGVRTATLYRIRLEGRY